MDEDPSWTQAQLKEIQKRYPNGYSTDITSCPRCGSEHGNIEFLPLPNPGDEWMYFATCPNTSAPILGTLAPNPKSKSSMAAWRERQDDSEPRV